MSTFASKQRINIKPVQWSVDLREKKDTKINRICHDIELHKNDIKTLILMPKYIQQT